MEDARTVRRARQRSVQGKCRLQICNVYTGKLTVIKCKSWIRRGGLRIRGHGGECHSQLAAQKLNMCSRTRVVKHSTFACLSQISTPSSCQRVQNMRPTSSCWQTSSPQDGTDWCSLGSRVARALRCSVPVLLV